MVPRWSRTEDSVPPPSPHAAHPSGIVRVESVRPQVTNGSRRTGLLGCMLVRVRAGATLQASPRTSPDVALIDREGDLAVVEVQGLRKLYGGRAVVDEVSFGVAAGEIFGIVGPNGAGKTTTVECIEGLRRPDAGRIRVLGLDPQRDARQVRRLLGAQLQQSRLPDRLEVWEAIDLYATFYEDPADPDELLELLGLTEHRNTRFAKLSGGQQQRLSIALALVGRPQVAVLDELTTGLDPRARRGTWTLIEQVRDRGVSILLVTHSMDEAERLCDRLAVIDRGRIVALETPAAIVDQAGGEHRLRFVPSVPVDRARLAGLAEVTDVEQQQDTLVVTGNEQVVQAVLAWLAREQVVAAQLRVVQPNLDDAFVALTGRSLEDANEPAVER
jgi:ABC-2 type transport system ATP-binding protein